MGKLTVSTQDMFAYDELYDLQTRIIAQELAQAINKNAVDEIKKLKQKYADCEEFVKARKFLDQKCKTTWNVFDAEKQILPAAAMKSLGITNQPTLDFLLGDSVRYFEKTNGSTTAQIIQKILDNKNLIYEICDIHNYLANLHKKEKIKYNINTALYLVKKHNYNKQNLAKLGISEKDVLKNLSAIDKTKYSLTYIKEIIKKIKTLH